MTFPEIRYPTTRETISLAMKVSMRKVREWFTAIGTEKGKALSPIDVKRFRERYIDGKKGED